MAREVIDGARLWILGQRGDICEDGAIMEQRLLVVIVVAGALGGLVVEWLADGLLTPDPLDAVAAAVRVVAAALAPYQPDPLLVLEGGFLRARRVGVRRVGAARNVSNTT